jgi:hypothetical protein
VKYNIREMKELENTSHGSQCSHFVGQGAAMGGWAAGFGSLRAYIYKLITPIPALNLSPPERGATARAQFHLARGAAAAACKSRSAEI